MTCRERRLLHPTETRHKEPAVQPIFQRQRQKEGGRVYEKRKRRKLEAVTASRTVARDMGATPQCPAGTPGGSRSPKPRPTADDGRHRKQNA